MLFTKVPVIKASGGGLPVGEPPIIIFRENASNVVYSIDYFETYTRVAANTTGGHRFWTQGNMKDYCAYKTADNKWHFTNDRGQTWNKVTAQTNSNMLHASDDGKYMFMGGNNGTSNSKFKVSTDYGASFTDVPGTILYNGYYGGYYGAISRTGKFCILNCRSKGIAINDNYLDPASWRSGLISSNLDGGRAPAISIDEKGWGFTSGYWHHKLVYEHNGVTGSGAGQISKSSGDGMSGVLVFKGANKIFFRLGTSNKIIQVLNGVESQVYNYDACFWTDDENTFVLMCDETGTIKVDDIDTGLDGTTFYQCANVSRNGHILLITSDYKLKYSNDKGNTWEDRTGTLNLSADSWTMKGQYNQMTI